MTQIRYARSGETQLGYTILEGERAGGDPEANFTVLYAVGVNYPFELMLEQPDIRRFLDGLAAMGRLVMYDRRGVGSSDPIVDWTVPLIDQWAEDIEAVVADAGLEGVNLFADLASPAVAWAARQPRQLERLILWNYLSGPGPSDQWAADLMAMVFANVDGADDLGAFMSPTSFADPAFRTWSDRAGRTGASPSQAKRMMATQFEQQMGAASDALLPSVDVPTLILSRRSARALEVIPDEYVARPLERLHSAQFVDLSPGDMFPTSDVDPILGEVSAFVTGERVALPRQRALAAVLFSDLVDSTATAQAMGDEPWKRLLDLHDSATRSAVDRHDGTLIKTTGDGVLATFVTASGAFAAARVLRRTLADSGLQIRIGIHAGEIDIRDDDVSGLAVNLAARVMGLARPGQILVTATASQAALGQGFETRAAGSHHLKGVEGDWELSELV